MNCLHCNKHIEGRRNTKKYCSNTCKQYAYLNRNFNPPGNHNVVLRQAEENKNQEQNNNHPSINPIPKSENYENIKKENQEKENVKAEERYHNIESDILVKIYEGHIHTKTPSKYFTANYEYGGVVTDKNSLALGYMINRIKCIVENLFQLSYKRKIYYRTAITIYKAIEEMLLSEHVKLLPNDFPFVDDLLKMHKQFGELSKYLQEDKEGVKFILSKAAIVRYIVILNLIRRHAQKQSFEKLFPEFYKIKANTKPNTVAA
jgi:hypothetical protein